MEKPEVLVVEPLMQSVMETLSDSYKVYALHEADNQTALIDKLADRIRAIATLGHAGASNSIMDKLPNLEVVTCFGVGVDGVDLDYTNGRNIQVTNTPGVLNDDVANLAIGLLLASSRALVESDKFVRRGDWQKGEMPLQRGIRGKKVGILGLGRIGKDIAKKLEVFGCHIGYHGRREQDDVSYCYYSDLVELAEDSEYLIAICPATEHTRRIVSEEVIDALGEDGTLINIARGSVVDEPALVAALKEGRLGAAALDVFVDEPNVPKELFKMPNVILTPHIGSATTDTRKAMGDLMLRNLELFFAGRPLATVIS